MEKAMQKALKEFDREWAALKSNPQDSKQRTRFNKAKAKVDELRSMQMAATLEEL